MSLYQQIEKDFVQALKNKDEAKISTLRMLKTAIKNKEIEQGKEKKLDDGLIFQIIANEIKSRKQAIAEYEKGKRDELAQKEKQEIEILQKYLPKQLSKQEIERIAEKIINQIGAQEPKDMGRVMAEIMPQVRGKADGALVSEIVREKLQR